MRERVEPEERTSTRRDEDRITWGRATPEMRRGWIVAEHARWRHDTEPVGGWKSRWFEGTTEGDTLQSDAGLRPPRFVEGGGISGLRRSPVADAPSTVIDPEVLLDSREFKGYRDGDTVAILLRAIFSLRQPRF